MAHDLSAILGIVLDKYTLPIDGDHGVAHWARVLENGLLLARQTGAKTEVVRLFAILHDSRRVDDGSDPDHGPRAAEFAKSIRGKILDLPDLEFNLLYRACAGHTHELTDPDLTIQTCYDADRLDLGRVGIAPDPSLLCTEIAKRPETIRWADGRARFHLVPDLVREEWGIEIE